MERAFIEQIATEMNEIMAYGYADDILVDESEQIDIELSDKALLNIIKQRAKEDLRPEDVGSFSPQVWQWFVDNKLAPKENAAVEVDLDANDGKPSEEADEREGNDTSDPDNEPAQEDGDGEVVRTPEPKPQPVPKKAKGKAKADTADNAQEAPKKPRKAKNKADTPSEPEKPVEAPEKPRKREADSDAESYNERKPGSRGLMVKGGNEKFAMELVQKGFDFDQFHAEFVDLYKLYRPEYDKAFVRSRARIYWAIAHKKLGKVVPAVAVKVS